jgi:hypothetical protein
MLISQKKAFERLRQGTGMSIDWCTKEVARYPKYPDGKRMKVNETDVEGSIRRVTAPIVRPAKKGNVRGFSPKLVARLRAGHGR